MKKTVNSTLKLMKNGHKTGKIQFETDRIEVDGKILE